MDFIMDNYLWFGIVGVVLLMALIGFLAEKTNFITSGNVRLKKNSKKKSSKKGNDESIVDDMSFTPDENIVNPEDMTVNSATEGVVNDIENIPAEILDVTSNENSEPTIESAPIGNTMWDNLEGGATAEQPVSTITETGEDLTVPLTDESAVVNNSNSMVGQNPTNNGSTAVEDEDIWKF